MTRSRIAWGLAAGLTTACSYLVDTGGFADPAPVAAADGGTPRDDLDGGRREGGGASDAAPPPLPRCSRDGGVALGAKTNLRGGTTGELVLPGYDLFATVMRDGAKYVMFWTQEGRALRAVSASPSGPWRSEASTSPNSFDVVLTPRADAYDAGIVGPSVIRVGGTLYMYYDGESAGRRAIGVASSTSGLAWTRLAGGAPILTPVDPNKSQVADGVAAFHASGKFYLAFSDLSAPGTTTVAGSPVGTFLVRSSDPTFPKSDMESLTATGWVPGDVRTFALLNARNGDVAYVPELERVVMVASNLSEGVHLSRLAPPFDLVSTSLDDPSRHLGVGLVREPDGTIPLGADCSTLSLDYVREVGGTSNDGATDLARFGFDVATR